MNTVEQQLTDALASLSESNWRKGIFFSAYNRKNELTNTLCMCSHGAVQKQISDKVKNLIMQLEASNMIGPMKCYNEPDIIRLEQEARTSVMYQSDVDGVLNSLFVSTDKLSTLKKWLISFPYHPFTAHAVLFAVGLTLSFNDDPCTTFEMITEKFQQAIELARQLHI